MCGVAQDTPVHSDTAHPLEAAMPPSITLGSEPPKPAGGLGERPPHQDPSSGKDIPTIDLSCDENDDLKKAIALSLQDQEEANDLYMQEVFRSLEASQIDPNPEATLLRSLSMFAEEHEMYRVLEASMRDSQPQATVDLLNPRERCRPPGRPVGLKNIGNSCWFNVVLQPLFHIPVFRDLILDFPQSLEQEEYMDESHKGPQLVPALRHLFALMIGSHRKYVDPSLAVQVFQGQEMRRNAQQDVCEFTHKLLERLEEEFQQLLRRQGVEKESSGRHISKDADFDNPIMKLFYGQAKKETCEGTSREQHKPLHHHQPSDKDKQVEEESPKQEAFGQYPLRVTNFGHIHDSILASMSSSAPAGLGPNAPSRQETWFKMLPPVLIFSLSRYEYSREKKCAEKVHNKFEFPEFLYMDRYMESNKDLVKEKQVKVASLKGKLGALNRTLDRYLKYGSGSAQYPIADILRYTLDFAQAGGGEQGQDAPSPPMMEVDASEDDVEMTEDGLEWIPRPSPSHKEEDGEMSGQHPPHQVPSPSKRMRLLPPAPRSISGAELATLEGCLTRWLKDINVQMEELKRLIGELEHQLSQVYEEPTLRQVPYRLHAAVVHEGQASSGHYWVYIHDPATGGWMKFNDIQVVEASWQEVLQDSVGGQNNTSAYCLLYIDQGRYPTLFPSAPKSQEDLLSGLALDLQEHIKSDNQAFTRELEEWDARQERAQVAQHVSQVKDAPETRDTSLPAPTPESPDVVCLREGEESKFFVEVDTMMIHMVRDALNLSSKKGTPAGQVLYPLLNQQVSYLQNLNVAHSDANGLYREPSLLDLGVYLMRNLQDADLLLQVYICEVVLHVARTLIQRSPMVEQVEREAIHLLRQLTDKQRCVEDNQYRGWMRHYHSLVDCAWHLVYGFKQQQKGGLEGALPHLLRACQIHQELQDRPPMGVRKTLDGKVLRRARNSCLSALSERTLDAFIKGAAEQAGEIPGVVNGLMVPAVAQLLSSDSEEDRYTVEKIREKWCGLLDSNLMPEAKQAMFSDLLQMIVNVSSETQTKTSGPFQTPRPPSLLQLYNEYTKCCNEIMSDAPPPVTPSPTIPTSKAQTSDL